MKKKLVQVLSVTLLLALISCGIYTWSILSYKKKVNALTFSSICASQVADGIYEGGCETGVVNALVRVTIENHQMSVITLLRHDNGRGLPAQQILREMLQRQSTDVELVSGATYSSKVIRKAVENALSPGLQ